MNINSTMKLVFGVIGLGIVISVVTVLQLNGLLQKVNQMSQVRYQSYQAADELRQSSDDLTRLGRTYVLTGDETYEKCTWTSLPFEMVTNRDRKTITPSTGIWC